MSSEMQVYCPKPRSSRGGQPCHEPMQKVNDRGVIVDVCPRDGTKVLDKGELERIIAAVSTMPGFNPHNVLHAQGHHGDSSDHVVYAHHVDSSDHHRRHRQHHRNSGGFLDDLFD